jgi:microcystin-dependent protein
MDSFLASIILFGGSYAPRNWTYCQGQVLPVSQNAALFSLLSNTYGGDGRSTFGIPDLRGRVPLGTGRGNGLTEFPLGRQAGRDSVVLATDNLAPHNHLATFTGSAEAPVGVDIQVSTEAATQQTPTANGFIAESAPVKGSTVSTKNFRTSADGLGTSVALGGVSVNGGGITGGTVTVENTGGSIPVSIMQPILAMNYILCVDGSYPART